MAVDFTAWLSDPTAIRCVLVEAVANVSGVDTTRYLSTKNYADTVGGRIYDPVVNAESVQLIERMSLDASPSMSFGDIEIYNVDGALDTWLLDIWVNKSVTVLVGDVRWLRADFTTIFSGTIDDIDSRSRDTLNIKVRDKLQKLNTPITETTLGGTSINKNELIPLCFGECFNVSPLLSNPATLEYKVHGAAIESIIEVRDNGVPVSHTDTIASGKFTLSSQPFGQVTASVQGSVSGTNLLTYSEQFNNAAWTPPSNGATVTANNAVAPDGTTTAELINDTSTTFSQLIRQVVVVVNDSTTYTFSIYIKKNTSRYVALWLSFTGSITREFVWTYDLDAITSMQDQVLPAASGVISDAGDGWRRLTITASNTFEGNTNLMASLYPATTGLGGVSPLATGSVLAWGAQLESSGIAYSYAKTESSPAANIYLKNAASIIKYLAINYGNPNTRFSFAELDLENLQEFEDANPQHVGIYIDDRDNTLGVCNQIASSVGAQLVMSRLGKLQLLKIELPASGTAFEIDTNDIIENSLSISQKIPVRAAFKVNYDKNWTVQEGLQTGIPEEHKDMYALEWLTVTAQDATVKTNYALDSEPVAVDTMLLTEADATTEATRLLDLYKTPRFVVTFTGTARLVELTLGSPVTITYPRFGMDSGKAGQVIGLSIDWSNLSVKCEVLI